MADEILFLSGINLDDNSIINVANPTNAQDVATKAYVDAVAQGLLVKDAVRLATTSTDGNIDLTTGGLLTIDGITVVAGNGILVKNQTDASENGIYTASATAWTRTADFDGNPSGEVRPGCFTFVTDGTQANTGWVVTGTSAITIDTTDINWTQFNGAGNIIAGNALSKTGNTLDVNVDNSTIEISTDALRVKDDGITKEKINADVAGSGLGQNVDGSLEVKVDNSTIEITTDTLNVKDSGIVEAKIANNAVTTNKINNDAVTKDKINSDVAGDGLGQNVDGSLEVKVDGTTIEITTDTLNVKDGGVTYSKLNSSALDTNLKTGASASTIPTSQAVVDLINHLSYSDTFTGDGSTKEFTITHNKNTRNVIVQVYQNGTPYQQVQVSIYADTVNTVKIASTKAFTNGVVYRVVVMAALSI